jgi:hypothetical protein
MTALTASGRNTSRVMVPRTASSTVPHTPHRANALSKNRESMSRACRRRMWPSLPAFWSCVRMTESAGAVTRVERLQTVK